MNDQIRRTVLVADDDIIMRSIVCAVLRESGYATLEAENGEQALAMARAHEPAMLVLDIEMPGMDGFQVCEIVRSDAEISEMPVLVLTGREDSDAIRRAFEIGATDFATKPLTAPLLAHRVRFMLRSLDTMRDLRHSETRLADAQRLARLGNWEWNVATGEVSGSPEMFAVLGFDRLVTGCTMADILAMTSRTDVARLEEALELLLINERTLDLAFRIVLPGDRERHVHVLGQLARQHTGRLDVRVAGTLQDITERTNAENRIRSLAYFDALTELPNRVMFMERVRMAMAMARRNQRKLALLLIDLDNFKGINDTLGHSAGDKVLREVGARIRAVVRGYDTVSQDVIEESLYQVARLGGDEFLVAAVDLTLGEEATAIGTRLLDALRAPMMIDCNELFVSASIGISVYPDDGWDFEELFKNADVALYHAKDAGRNTSSFFNASMNDASRHRLQLENALRRSLERDEMVVHYQPQFDVVSGRLVAVEALLRWTHPELGSVSPAVFIPLAERIGFIAHITEFVMTRACEQLRLWQLLGATELRMAVNLSAQLFRQEPEIARLSMIPEACQVSPRSVELEITETALLDDPAGAEQILCTLRARGFRIALDDFGVGFSSLSHLRRFALDTLKIDQSFVSDLVSGTRELAIVGAMIDLAHSLGIEPVAEGIENEAQRDMLIKKGCAVMQGFLFGRPMTPDQLLPIILEYGMPLLAAHR
ncbi:MAG: EAL domain-containing protein [Gemmatimonas sp.]